MSDENAKQMSCMQVWGGSHPVSSSVEMRGLDAWVYSRPYAQAAGGGDIYYASACATGRINRLLLADVSGHGDAVAETATQLRGLMGRYVNFLDQSEFVRSMNHQFVSLSPEGCYATAIVTTFFAPTRRLTVCNAGHPRPLWYRHAQRQWIVLRDESEEQGEDLIAASAAPAEAEPHNIPLGLVDLVDYEQIDVEMDVGDLLLCYTDALSESRTASGALLGEKGLLDIVQSVDIAEPSTFIDRLLQKIAALNAANLGDDDATVLLLRPTGDTVAAPFADRVRGLWRMAKSILRGLGGRSQRPAWPELSVPNIGGAVIPSLSQRWRVRRKRKPA
jgi:sigma-B regulation protein RsbU (phosphoserine phosphatase)